MAVHFDGINFDGSLLAIRYGQSKTNTNYKRIANIEDDIIRNQEIDKIINQLDSDKESSGFFGPTDTIYINRMYGSAFKLDDKEIYYLYFKFLHDNFKKYEKSPEGAIIVASIANTITSYLGNCNGDQRKRLQLTSTYYDEDDNLVTPSIKTLKNKNIAACVEYASIAHNLCLLSGTKSHYISSKDVDFGINIDDGHAFVITENNGTFRLIDVTLGKYLTLAGNPIESMQNKEPLVVGNLVYANASYLSKEIEKD